MKPRPLVTVLMPVYNAERFLKQAIDSILQQTFTQLELLIINDSSTDQSLSIIQQYTDPRIRVINNERNKGIAHTLNTGLEHTTTSLVARMDADDISYPQRIAKQFAYMQQHPDCVLLNTWAREVLDGGQHLRIERLPSEHFYYNMTFECRTYHPTVMFRKEAVLALGGYPSSHSEDYILFSKLLRHYKIANLDEVLVDCRHCNESTHRVVKKKEYDEAHHEQVIDNIQYFTGKHYILPYEVLEALKWNFTPLIEAKNLQLVFDMLQHLDAITVKIMEKENPNRNIDHIKKAAALKRKYTLFILIQMLPFPLAVRLLLKLKSWNTYAYLAKETLKTVLGFKEGNFINTSQSAS